MYPILLKGLYQDSLNISDIFLDVKTEMDFVKKKKLRQKMGTQFKP